MSFLLKNKRVLSVIVAAGVLVAIFVPFQRAEAFTLVTTLPNTTGNTTTQSSSGERFDVTITVGPGELLPLHAIDTIIDNGQSSMARTTFTVSGATATRSSGAPGIIKDNTLTLSLPSVTRYGYAYGYGLVSSGISGPSGYSYAFPSSTGFIGNNNVGYSNAVGNPATGFVGPATITISGFINTALLSAGSHTLDVIVDTNGGAAPEHLVAPQISFTVNANTGIIRTTVSPGTNVALPPITIPGSSTPVTIVISNVQSGGTVAAEIRTPSALRSQFSNIFTAIGSSTSIFTVGTSTANTVGIIFDIDISAITLGSGATIDVTIPYDPSLLPSTISESNVKFYHWTGTAWEDKTLSVDTAANTVTGRLTSLSPVVAGFVPTTPSVSTGTGGGGGGGGGGGSLPIDLTTTYPDEYFKTNPLAKVQLQSVSFANGKGTTVFGAKPGEQITIGTTFKNYQKGEQSYAIIIQVINSDGYTTDIGWVQGKLAAGETTSASRSWTAGESGSYTVKMFVWNGVSGAPTPLSVVTDRVFAVS